METRRVSRPELEVFAKAQGVKYLQRYSRSQLAEMLGINHKPPVKRPKPTKKRTCMIRAVQIVNPDGTTTNYRSMCPTKALVFVTCQIYTVVSKGTTRFL